MPGGPVTAILNVAQLFQLKYFIKPLKQLTFYGMNYHFLFCFMGLHQWFSTGGPIQDSKVGRELESVKISPNGIFYHIFPYLTLFSSYSTIISVCNITLHKKITIISFFKTAFVILVTKVESVENHWPRLQVVLIKVLVSASALFTSTQSNPLWRRRFVNVPVWQLCFYEWLCPDAQNLTPDRSLSTSSAVHPLFLPSSPGVSLCLCLSPVSCALFQGWGLRHTFHLAYEALILFRGCSSSGESERGKRWG